MELYQLEYFLETARELNFTRAARRLNIAQTALSEQIKKLESELETQLFQRGSRRSILTSAGETLRVHAEIILEKARAARTAVRDLMALRGGRVSIGTIPSASACLLPKAISEFKRRHPNVELALHEGTTEAVSQWVENGRAEFGVVQLPAAGTGFEEEILLSEPFVILAPRGRFPSSVKAVSLSSLAQDPFILYKGRARDSALNACRTAGFEPRIACESSELETIRSLVNAGLGLALLPSLATRLKSTGCIPLSILDAPVSRHVAILKRRSHSLSPGAEAFIQILRQYGEQKPASGKGGAASLRFQ